MLMSDSNGCREIGALDSYSNGAMAYCEAYAAIHRFFYFHIVHSPPFRVTLVIKDLILSRAITTTNFQYSSFFHAYDRK